MKTFIIILSIFLFTGCISTTTPAINEFRVNSDLEFSALDKGKCKTKSLKIAQAFSASSLKSLKMKYSYGNNKQFAYSQSQWAQSPNQAITQEVTNLLRELELFSSVQIDKSRSRSDTLLEISIDDFTQYFSENGTESYAKVVISFTFIDTKLHKILATKTFKHVTDATTLNAEGGVDALNRALRNVLLASGVWFEDTCK